MEIGKIFKLPRRILTKLPRRILTKKGASEKLSQILDITTAELNNCVYNFRHLHSKAGIIIVINTIALQISVVLLDFEFYVDIDKVLVKTIFPFVSFLLSTVSIIFMGIIVWNIRSSIHTVKVKELYCRSSSDLLKGRIQENIDSISEIKTATEKLLPFFSRGCILLLISISFLVSTVVIQTFTK